MADIDQSNMKEVARREKMLVKQTKKPAYIIPAIVEYEKEKKLNNQAPVTRKTNRRTLGRRRNSHTFCSTSGSNFMTVTLPALWIRLTTVELLLYSSQRRIRTESDCGQ